MPIREQPVHVVHRDVIMRAVERRRNARMKLGEGELIREVAGDNSPNVEFLVHD
jgi:hypothetical protein